MEKFKEKFNRDAKSIREFYLDSERREKLQEMRRFRRMIFTTVWILKSLYFKLNSFRRFLLLLGIFFLFPVFNFQLGVVEFQLSDFFRVVSAFLFLFLLMLELMDKLAATDELQEGRLIQLALQPEASPEIPGWDVWLYSRPANHVGGDLVDHLKLSKENHNLILGDVSGKGLSAALLMAKLQSTIRALAYDQLSLVQLGDRVNEIFFRDGISKSFATLLYLQLDANSNSIQVLNAGHLPPLLLSSGCADEKKKGKGRALGLCEDSQFQTFSLSMKTGELLFVFSDGITEAMNEEEDFFGLQRLKDLLPECQVSSAEEAGQRILDEVSQFVKEQPPHDDLSLIILKRL